MSHENLLAPHHIHRRVYLDGMGVRQDNFMNRGTEYLRRKKAVIMGEDRSPQIIECVYCDIMSRDEVTRLESKPRPHNTIPAYVYESDF